MPTISTVPNKLQFDRNRSTEEVTNNRAHQISRETDTFKNFSVKIKDIDETIFNHLKKMQLSVVDNGNVIKVPVSYASPEKWKSVRNDGFMRDNNGRIILPAIIFYRTSMDMDKSMPTFNKYLQYPAVVPYSKKNQYTKFSTLMRKNSPISEVYNVVVPDYMNFNYKFIIWTEYVEQMNSLVERINFETNDYWGTDNGFRFRTNIESYSHITEVQSDSDRLVRTEFDLLLKGYLLPNKYAPGLEGFKSTTQKSFTRKKIIISAEVVCTNENLTQNNYSDKWKNQNYPNIDLNTTLPTPGIDFV